MRVTLESGQTAGVDLRLYGPGDVIGVDPRGIVRTEPPRFARNVAPDQFAAIEFDAPDFPWMFTPAAGDRTTGCGRGWCWSSSRKQPGVAIDVRRDRPLPQLTIEAPAVPGDELPDLSESWAWAHTHVVEDGGARLGARPPRAQPELNVSRLLCPRRLESGEDYIAALVPAFERGRLAGLGQTVPDAATTTAAWGGSGGVGATVTLPLYYHWEFRTGPPGTSSPSPASSCPARSPTPSGGAMFIGAAHPALPGAGRRRRWRHRPRGRAAGTGGRHRPDPRPRARGVRRQADRGPRRPGGARRSTAPRPTRRRSPRRSTAGGTSRTRPSPAPPTRG